MLETDVELFVFEIVFFKNVDNFFDRINRYMDKTDGSVNPVGKFPN